MMWIEEVLEKPKRIAWNKGLKGVITHSEETKRRISEGMKQYWAEKKQKNLKKGVDR